MRNFIGLVLSLSFMTSLAYGSTTLGSEDVTSIVSVARISIVFGGPVIHQPFPPTLQAVEDHEAQADLTLESRLLFPYREHPKPEFYRIAYTVNGQSRISFILGSAHICPITIFPQPVLKALSTTDRLVSEIGENLGKIEGEDDLLKEYSLANALRNDGTFFGKVEDRDTEGWLKLVSAACEVRIPPEYKARYPVLQDTLKDALTLNLRIWGMDEYMIRNLHRVNPKLFVNLIIESMTQAAGLVGQHGAAHMSMDRVITATFQRRSKPIFALENDDVRLTADRKALEAGCDPDIIDTVETSVDTLVQIFNSNQTPEECEKLRQGIEKVVTAHKAVIKAYRMGNLLPEDEESFPWNFRNQHWHLHIIKHMYEGETPLFMVGARHMDMGIVPGIGKTGVLNMLQKLYETETSWDGLTIVSIERLVQSHPHSKWTSERNQYEWKPWTVSTEGAYLEDFVGSLRRGLSFIGSEVNIVPRGASTAAAGAGGPMT